MPMVILVMWLLSSVNPMTNQQSAATPSDSAALNRVQELIKLINSGDRREAAAYIKDHYAPSFLKIPMDAHLNFISRLNDQTRGVEFHSLQESKPAEAVALLKSKLTGGWTAMIVRIESEAPYRITNLGLTSPKPPADLARKEKLTDDAMAKELEEFVRKLAAADLFSGTVLLARQGQPIFKKAYGTANRDFNVPNRIDTKFNLGSMNKMFTSVAIAQLVERGKLSFEDRLSKFVPDFPSKEEAEKIQIRHLLTHTSGLGSYFNKKFDESSRALFRTVDDMMKLTEGDKLAFEPGTRWQYSNTGMLVLGKVIEKASGQDYFDYIRENIYKPAGMINSDCYQLDEVNPNLAVGYEKTYTEKGTVVKNNIFRHVIRGGPAGGGYSTVEDLLKFDLALRSGKLVGAEYVKLLLSAKPELNSPDYGYGFGINREKHIVGHSGGFPGIHSNLDLFLDNGYTAVMMSNYGGGSFAVVEKLQELVLAGQDAKVAGR
ncbi:MAG TPA: serine hydrolase domain-containing protein [Blastocatellia bacterium]|nr:serine hydrolase domain-containing protein [Blastocatellia bacterium]